MPELSGQTLTVTQLADCQRKLGIIPGAFLPVGGNTNQVLGKLSPADYDAGWMDILGGLVLAGNGIVFSGGNTVHFAQAAAYTVGAVPFATGVATMGFDAANLFWDNTNDYLGIGTAIPDAPIDVRRAWAVDANMIGIHAVVTNSAPLPSTASFHAAVTVAFTLEGLAQYTHVTDTAIGVAGQGRYNGTYAGAGYGCRSVTGGRFTAAKVNSGTVANMYGLRGGVENQFNGGAVDSGFGVYVTTPQQTLPGGTITTYYGLYVDAPAGTTTYGLYLAAGSGTTNYGLYVLGTSARNYIAGPLDIATLNGGTTYTLRCERNHAVDASLYGIYSIVQNTPGADTATVLRGAYIACRVAGANNYTLATDSALGVQAQGLHNGTGTVAGMTGLVANVIKQSTGPITAAYGCRVQIQNADATNAITAAYGFYGQTPGVTGTITTYYGLYLAAGAGSTIYGIYQAAPGDLNALLGKTGLGIAPSTTTWACLGASTASISSMRVTAGSAAYTGTVEGDFWNDYTQKCLIGYIDGLKQYDSRVCFVMTASQTITNTNAETTCFGTGIGTLTYPADFFVVGKTLKINIRGIHTMDATAPDLTFRVKLGGTTYATKTYSDHNDTNRYIEITFLLTCRTTGGGGTAIGQGALFMAEATDDCDCDELVMTATAALNTTAAATLDVTCQPSAADAGSSVTFTNAIVEVKA